MFDFISLRYWYLILGVFIALCFYAEAVWATGGVLTVKFLDVGQGDSILIETPKGKKILVDGGPGSTVLERLGEEDYFLDFIDLVILTHPDADHIEGLISVLDRYEVGAVMMSGVHHTSAMYGEFLRLIQEKDITTVYPLSDQDYEIEEGVFLDILYPLKTFAGLEVPSTNNAAIVAKLIYGKSEMLLTGDAEDVSEVEQLMTDQDLSADFLKVGHHGSRTSTTLPYLLAIRSEVAVIMSGRENQFGHPHEETLEKLRDHQVAFWNTSDEGTLTFVSGGEEWTRE